MPSWCQACSSGVTAASCHSTDGMQVFWKIILYAISGFAVAITTIKFCTSYVKELKRLYLYVMAYCRPENSRRADSRSCGLQHASSTLAPNTMRFPKGSDQGVSGSFAFASMGPGTPPAKTKYCTDASTYMLFTSDDKPWIHMLYSYWPLPYRLTSIDEWYMATDHVISKTLRQNTMLVMLGFNTRHIQLLKEVHVFAWLARQNVLTRIQKLSASIRQARPVQIWQYHRINFSPRCYEITHCTNAAKIRESDNNIYQKKFLWNWRLCALQWSKLSSMHALTYEKKHTWQKHKGRPNRKINLS